LNFFKYSSSQIYILRCLGLLIVYGQPFVRKSVVLCEIYIKCSCFGDEACGQTEGWTRPPLCAIGLHFVQRKLCL